LGAAVGTADLDAGLPSGVALQPPKPKTKAMQAKPAATFTKKSL